MSPANDPRPADARTADARPTPRPYPARWIAIGAALVAALAWSWVVGLPLLGWDSYPLLAATRLDSFGDLGRLFTSELMDGRYPDGHFHRPLVHLSFALDQLLGGDAATVHATDLALLAANTALLTLVARRLFGPRALLAVVAGLVFALHPIQVEVVPFAPRRADTLALLFLLLAFVAQPRPGEAARARHWILGLLLGWAATASKESGAVAALLVPAWHLATTPGAAPARLRAAVVRGAPVVLGVALQVGLRALVLRGVDGAEGLGGHAESSLANLGSAGQLAHAYAVRLLYPQPLFGGGLELYAWPLTPAPGGALAGAMGGVAVGAVLLLLGALWCGLRTGTSVVAERATQRGGVAFLGLWFAALLAVSALAGRVHDWYAMLFAAPYALLLGLLVERGAHAVHARRTRVAGGLALALAAPLALSHALVGAPLSPPRNLRDAGRLETQMLTALDDVLRQAGPGHVLRLNPWFPGVAPHSDGSEVRGVPPLGIPLLADYSVQAYVDRLGLPVPVQVHVWSGRSYVPDPNAATLELVPGPPPSWLERR